MSKPLHTNPTPTPTSYRPDLPDWGSYLRWPSEDQEWIHEEDIESASELLPSRRIWKRYRWDGEFYWLSYGTTVLRVRPTMWTRVPDIDLEVGQQIELLGRHGRNDRGIFRIHEILYSQQGHIAEYYLRRDELILERAFHRVDLKPTYIKHSLRSEFYQHQPPRLAASSDIDSLDVGDLD